MVCSGCLPYRFGCIRQPACAISQVDPDGRYHSTLRTIFSSQFITATQIQNCQDEKRPIEGHPCSLANLSTFKKSTLDSDKKRRESSSRHKPCATHIYLRLGIFLPGCTVFYPLFISYYTVDLAVLSLSISISVIRLLLLRIHRILALPIKCPVPPLTFRGAARKRTANLRFIYSSSARRTSL